MKKGQGHSCVPHPTTKDVHRALAHPHQPDVTESEALEAGLEFDNCRFLVVPDHVVETMPPTPEKSLPFPGPMDPFPQTVHPVDVFLDPSPLLSSTAQKASDPEPPHNQDMADTLDKATEQASSVHTTVSEELLLGDAHSPPHTHSSCHSPHQQASSSPSPPACDECRPVLKNTHASTIQQAQSPMDQLHDINQTALKTFTFNKKALSEVFGSATVANNYIASLHDGCKHIIEDIMLDYSEQTGLTTDQMDVDETSPAQPESPCGLSTAWMPINKQR